MAKSIARITVSTTLEPHVVDDLDRAAQAAGLRRSELVRQAIEDLLHRTSVPTAWDQPTLTP